MDMYITCIPSCYLYNHSVVFWFIIYLFRSGMTLEGGPGKEVKEEFTRSLSKGMNKPASYHCNVHDEVPTI
jgi:hypothetical protein